MVGAYITRIIWFVCLVLAQVLVLNNILLWGVARPFLYIYIIMKFDTNIGRKELLLWAFFLGLTVDIFNNTPGAGAAALVLMAFIRPVLLNLFVPRDIQNEAVVIPSIRRFGLSVFLKYALSFILMHNAILLALEQFSVSDIGMYLLRLVGCTLFTLAFVIALEIMGRR